MIPFSFESKVVSPGQFGISEEVEAFSEDAFTLVTVENGTVVWYGEDTGETAISVRTGSLVAIKVKGSNEPGTASYGRMTIGNQSAVFSLVTDETGIFLNDRSNPALPLDYKRSAEHKGISSWIPQVEPVLYTKTGQSWSVPFDLDTAVPTNSQSEVEYAFLASTFANCVFRVDLNNKTLAQKIPVTLPVGVARAEMPDAAAETIYHIFVLQSSGTVVRLDPRNNYAVAQTYYVGQKPVAIISGPDNTLWVANSNNTVSVINVETSVVTPVVLPTGSIPSSLSYDETTGKVVVSIYNSDSLAIIDNLLQVNVVSVGFRPSAVDANEGVAYVLCAEGKVSKVDINASTVTEHEVGTNTDIGSSICVGDGYVRIGDAQTGTMLRMPLSMSPVESFHLSDVPTAEYSFFGTTEIALKDVTNPVSRVSPPDIEADYLAFVPALDRPVGISIDSSNITVQGINHPVNVSTDPFSGALVVKNGIESGTFTVAEDGDTLAIRVNTPDDYETVKKAYMTVGKTISVFTVSTINQGSVPYSIEFTQINEALPQQEYLSNIVTVEGMEDGRTLPVTVTGGFLIHNGTDVTSTSIQNGDTLQLKGISAAEGDSHEVVLHAGPIEASFVIVSVSLETCESIASLLVFDDIEGAELGSVVTSNQIIVSGLENPTTIRLGDAYYGEILLDGIPQGRILTVSNGDRVSLRMSVSAGYNIDHYLYVSSCGTAVRWRVLSEPDLTPFYFALPDVVQGDPEIKYDSDEHTIRGMSPGFDTDASVYPECEVYVNDVLLNPTIVEHSGIPFEFTLREGDVVKFASFAGLPYGSYSDHTIRIGDMVTRFRVKSKLLEGGFENAYNLFLVLYDRAEFEAHSSVRPEFQEPTGDARHSVVTTASSNTAQKTINVSSSAAVAEATITGVTTALSSDGPAVDTISYRHGVLENGAARDTEHRQLKRRDFGGVEASAGKRKVRFTNSLSAIGIHKSTDTAPSLTSEYLAKTVRTADALDIERQPSVTFRASNIGIESAIVRPDRSRGGAVPLSPETVVFSTRETVGREPATVTFPTRNGVLLSAEKKPNSHYYSGTDFDNEPKTNTYLVQGQLGVASFSFRDVEHFGWYKDITTFQFGKKTVLSPEHNTRKATTVSTPFIPTQHRLNVIGFERFPIGHHSHAEWGDSLEPIKLRANKDFAPALDVRLQQYTKRFASLLVMESKGPSGARVDIAPLDPSLLTYSQRLFQALDAFYSTPTVYRDYEAVPEVTDRFTVAQVAVPSRSYEVTTVHTYEDKDHTVLTPDLMGYHDSAAEAEADALASGVEPSRVQTFELHPGCWVWSELLDTPDLCAEDGDEKPVAGWIQGG